ncbi:uncharacterized protein TRIADDRAFT_52265 [Trichoplax adhaerens]|uniref:Uncharacterized protein n=1 Tax=Trichoplax adhaerens TaxID=10228 RepID=B3RM79_TRIAD|nr:predicted protein [Trichoplax adhaerens]EDV29651.1 predicted protein [Trichoplax adhaerens]|eukprot:XP_002108853.1 predicted protein [Trichoplax adhaerens]
MATATVKKSRIVQSDLKNLLIISSKIPSPAVLIAAVKSQVIVVQYQYEESTLQMLRDKIHRSLQGKKIALIGVLLHGQPGKCNITGKDNKTYDSLDMEVARNCIVVASIARQQTQSVTIKAQTLSHLT